MLNNEQQFKASIDQILLLACSIETPKVHELYDHVKHTIINFALINDIDLGKVEITDSSTGIILSISYRLNDKEFYRHFSYHYELNHKDKIIKVVSKDMTEIEQHSYSILDVKNKLSILFPDNEIDFVREDNRYFNYHLVLDNAERGLEVVDPKSVIVTPLPNELYDRTQLSIFKTIVESCSEFITNEIIKDKQMENNI